MCNPRRDRDVFDESELGLGGIWLNREAIPAPSSEATESNGRDGLAIKGGV